LLPQTVLLPRDQGHHDEAMALLNPASLKAYDQLGRQLRVLDSGR
jgi:hypothetical protein